MKKVLILSYHFPPEGGVAVQRVLKFVKYLPMFGYQPIVLTALHPIKKFDPDALRGVPAQLKIYKTRDLPAYMPGEIRKVMRKKCVPDKHIFWKWTAVRKGIQLVKKHNIQLVFSTSPPHSVQLIAQEIAQRTNIKHVADFRDEWSGDLNFYKLPNTARQLELESKICEESAAIITLLDSARRNFASKTNIRKIFTIPNGYDASDFSKGDNQNRSDTKLRMTYCGRFSNKASPEAFLRALDETIRQDSSIRQLVQLQIVGPTGNKSWFKPYPELKKICDFVPFQPYKKSLDLMDQADVLLLFASNEGNKEGIPAKTFEYFYLRKPVLLVVNSPGELSKLVQTYSNAYIGFKSPKESITGQIQKLVTEWKNGKHNKPVDDVFVNQFDRKKQTQALAQIFDHILRNESGGGD
ncbi:MAG: glycosyltransferase [Calditrichaeota bacterium]|nr:MAG: glycosyltransferase [Calditrichota bacterium]